MDPQDVCLSEYLLSEFGGTVIKKTSIEEQMAINAQINPQKVDLAFANDLSLFENVAIELNASYSRETIAVYVDKWVKASGGVTGKMMSFEDLTVLIVANAEEAGLPVGIIFGVTENILTVCTH